MNINTEITYQQKKLITVLSCILLFVITYRVFIAPDIEKSKLLQLEYETACMSKDSLEMNVMSMTPEQLLEELETNSENYEEMQKLFLTKMTSEEISLMISEILEENRITPDSMKIGEPIPLKFPVTDEETEQENISKTVSMVEVEFSFSAKYSSITDLVKQINSINSICISNFSFKSDDMDFIADMTIKIYMI